MPSTATITAFYSFTANTKARATQVNGNFDVFRGHIIPIAPNTQTAINNTYDLGSTEYRWRNLYVKEIDFNRNTSTASLTIASDPNTTASELIFKLDGTEKARINTNGVNKTLVSSSTITASAGQLAQSANINANFALTTGVTNVSGSTLTISTLGRPIRVELMNSTTTVGGIYMTLISGFETIDISLLKNGSTTATYRLGGTPTSTSQVFYSSPTISFLDVANAGSYVYSLSVKLASSSQFLNIANSKLTAIEL